MCLTSCSIIQPLRPSPIKSDVILYLPRGSLFARSQDNVVQADTAPSVADAPSVPSLLASSLPLATILTLNYGLSASDHIYPDPIHGVLAGFDWIRRNLAPPRLSIYGSHIGGSLAAMLALTEPKHIHSVAVDQPICDWVSLEDHKPSEKRGSARKSQKAQDAQAARNLELEALMATRSKSFRSQSDYFDPFASPTLLLRATDRECRPDQPLPWFEGPYDEDAPRPEQPTVKRRKVLKRWPPWGLDDGKTDLPLVNVLVEDTKGILTQQGEELAELMWRACFFGKSREEAMQTVSLTKVEKERASEEDVALEAARWFAMVLNQETPATDSLSEGLENRKIT